MYQRQKAAESRCHTMEWVMMFWVACALVLSSQLVQGQRPHLGRCPKVESARNFKISKFLGKWYEVERSFYIYGIPTSCTTLDISRPDNTTRDLWVTIKTINKWTRQRIAIEGKATPKGDGSANLEYRVNSLLPEFMSRFLPAVGSYTLLATDHDTYAVLYSCSDIRFAHADLIWILGRKRDIPVWARVEAYEKLVASGFGTEPLTLTHGKNCPDL